MGKIGKILSPEDVAIAEKNGVPLSTVYARLRREWDIQRAITQPPKASPQLKRDKEGEFSTEEEKGKPRGVRFPKSKDDLIDKAIADSGMTQSDFIVFATMNYIESKQKKTRGRKKKS